MQKKERQSNYELLRIVSMFLIVIQHVIMHGAGLVWNSSGTVRILSIFLQVMIIIHVNSYILVTGYFQCKTKFKWKNVFSLAGLAWFYKVAILLLFYYFNLAEISRIDFLRNLFPLDLDHYWFIKAYLILYCLSPFLNLLIEKMTKKQFQHLLLTLFGIFSIIATITKQEFTVVGCNGYSVVQFIFLYFIGSYFRCYPIKESSWGKKRSPGGLRLTFAVLFIGCFLINGFIYLAADAFMSSGNVMQYIANIIYTAGFSYDNPLVIIGSIAYFLWFGTLAIKSKFLNRVASLTLGVYLIHDNTYVRNFIYQKLGFLPGTHFYGYRVFIQVLIVAIIIFISCLLIEFVRKTVASFLAKTKLVTFFKRKWQHYLTTFQKEETVPE